MAQKVTLQVPGQLTTKASVHICDSAYSESEIKTRNPGAAFGGNLNTRQDLEVITPNPGTSTSNAPLGMPGKGQG